MRSVALLALCFLLAGCSTLAETTSTAPAVPAAPQDTVRILLVGDIMTGRGVASILENDPDDVFARIRHLLVDADLVAGNLESPLTLRPHTSSNKNMLEADPDTAQALASAGFDLMSLPNNHSTDAGPDGLLDTLAAVNAAGMRSVGGGPDAAAAYATEIVAVDDLRVGFLAFDATGVGEAARDDTPGVAAWDEAVATQAVHDLQAEADVVIVSIHGGTEYLPVVDPGMAAIGATLATAGVDVVWGHGAHVVQPVSTARGSVVATSLGNFLFDQSGQDRTTGAMVEVIADAAGVIAYRVGLAAHPDRRVKFVEWLEPEGDAVWLHESWWNLVRDVVLATDTTVSLKGFRHGDLTTAVRGNVTGDGEPEIVVSFRRPHRTTPFMEIRPELQWADATGRSTHLGVYEPDDLTEIWVAGSVLLPIANLQVCDGSLATIHDSLDDTTRIAAGAWVWNGFGFETAPDIPGNGTPGCTDIDGDGRTEPVITDR